MAGRPRKTSRLTVSLEDQDYDALAQIAEARDVSLSWVIRQAIREFIEWEAPVEENEGKTRHARTTSGHASSEGQKPQLSKGGAQSQ